MKSRSGTKGKKKLYLFVCRANVDRSPTAEEVCRRMAKKKKAPVKAVSAGISPAAVRPLTRDLVDAADLIFVMEEWMRDRIVEEYGKHPSEVVCLYIPDAFSRGEPRLVRLIEEAIAPYIE